MNALEIEEAVVALAEEAIQRLMDGSILDFAYNTKTAQLTKK